MIIDACARPVSDIIKNLMRDCFVLISRNPTPGEYQALRAAAGLNRVDLRAAEEGLSNSLYSVCVVHRSAVVGMGRVVGDRGLYFYIQDLLVLPAYQGLGLEKIILDNIMSHLRDSATEDAVINSMASEVAAGFCERFGLRDILSADPGPSGDKEFLYAG
jgi:ribosomal protein S18 acetylase RimI-like enzyme